jgi:hypothetical protein
VGRELPESPIEQLLGRVFRPGTEAGDPWPAATFKAAVCHRRTIGWSTFESSSGTLDVSTLLTLISAIMDFLSLILVGATPR